MDIGVIGLGQMGAGIAKSLIRAGHRVRVWNRSPDKTQALVALGAQAVASAADAFAGEAVVTMLANDAAVREAILDAGLIEDAPKSLIHISCSTLSMELALELEQRHARAGVGYVSAPVLGRPPVAEQGQLNTLAGGDPAVIDRARPVLDAFSKQVWPIGEAAHKANLVKLAVNMTLANAIEAMGEAFALARSWDVEPAQVAELLTGTLFDAPAYRTYAPLIVEGRYEPAGFKLSLGLKDVREALRAGELKGAPLPFASVVRDNFIDAVAHGDGDKDWAALGSVAARRAGL